VPLGGGDGKRKIVHLALGAGYDAARVLLPDFHEHASKAVGSNTVAVIIPSRDKLTVFPIDEGESLDAIEKVARDACAQGPYSLTPEVLVFPDDLPQGSQVPPH
jgi:hypothetical protein